MPEESNNTKYFNLEVTLKDVDGKEVAKQLSKLFNDERVLQWNLQECDEFGRNFEVSEF